MSTSKTTETVRGIPVRQLSLSPLNVRKTGGDEAIEELAALIAAQGLLQNLIVYQEDEPKKARAVSYAVVAGGRRWRALQWLVKQKRMPADTEVSCLIVSYERAIEISLAENSGRVAMHPADQFEAFKRLIDAGQSIEDVAARFGVAPLIVQRRLKLANVAPSFLALYRDGAITLEHLMALSITDDHERQQQAWQSLKDYERHPSALRRALTVDEVPVSDPLVRFVGLKVYEKAGGGVRRDLFSENEAGFVMDPAILTRLATEKLEKAAVGMKKEGLAWVEVMLRPDCSEKAAYKRVRMIEREATAEEQAQLDALQEKLAQIETQMQAAGEDEERYDALAEEAGQIEDQIEALNDAREVPHPQETARAGALVSIGGDGKVEIQRGLLRPADADRLRHGKSTRDPSDAAQPPRVHSAALMRRLTAQRTLALQATLAQRPDVALIALTHRLAIEEFFLCASSRASVLQVSARAPELRREVPGLDEVKAQRALAALREEWRAQMPQDPQALFGWLLQQPQAQVLALLAVCVARSVDAVRAEEGTDASDALAAAAGLDMRQWWTATAENYLASIPRARVLDVLREATSPEVAGALSKLQKGPLVKAAEERLAGTGWLPAVLRTAAA